MLELFKVSSLGKLNIFLPVIREILSYFFFIADHLGSAKYGLLCFI